MTGSERLDLRLAVEVADAFELGAVTAVSGVIGLGAEGSVYRLDSESGSWAIKVAHPWSVERSTTDAQSLQIAAGHRGVLVAEPRIPRPTGASILAGRRVQVSAWLDLDQPLRVPAQDDVAEEVGELLARLHATRIPTTSRTPPAYFTDVPTGDDWTRLLERSTDQRPELADLVARVCAKHAALDEVASHEHVATQLCHLDLRPTNVRPARSHPGLAVLDWDNCAPADPARETAQVLFDWCDSPNGLSTAAAQHLLGGYQQAGGTALPVAIAHFSLIAATTRNFLYLMTDAATATESSAARRSYAETKLRKYDSAPITTAKISELQRIASQHATGPTRQPL